MRSRPRTPNTSSRNLTEASRFPLGAGMWFRLPDGGSLGMARVDDRRGINGACDIRRTGPPRRNPPRRLLLAAGRASDRISLPALIAGFFSKIEPVRHIATRHDSRARNPRAAVALAAIALACIRPWPRHPGSTPRAGSSCRRRRPRGPDPGPDHSDPDFARAASRLRLLN
jgi:transposase